MKNLSRAGRGMKKFIYIFLVVLVLFVGLKVISGQKSKKTLGQSSVLNKKPTPTPIITWKTYTNDKLGFSLKYPSDWSEPVLYRQNLRTEVHFLNDDFVVFLGKIWRQEKQRLITYDDYMAEFVRDTGVEGETATTAGVLGKKFPNSTEIEGKKAFTYIFPTKNKNVILEIYGRSNPTDTQVQGIYNQILESFKLSK